MLPTSLSHGNFVRFSQPRGVVMLQRISERQASEFLGAFLLGGAALGGGITGSFDLGITTGVLAGGAIGLIVAVAWILGE
jgi:hypothetical protein